MATTEISNIKEYPVFDNALRYGLMAGGLVALGLFIVQLLGLENSIGTKYATYSLLGMVLAIGLTDYDQYLREGKTFSKGMVFAGQISLIAGASLIGIHLVAFITGSDFVFTKYGVEATTLGKWVVLSTMIFFEIMVFGLIFTFMVLQYLKTRKE